MIGYLMFAYCHEQSVVITAGVPDGVVKVYKLCRVKTIRIAASAVMDSCMVNVVYHCVDVFKKEVLERSVPGRYWKGGLSTWEVLMMET